MLHKRKKFLFQLTPRNITRPASVVWTMVVGITLAPTELLSGSLAQCLYLPKPDNNLVPTRSALGRHNPINKLERRLRQAFLER